MYLVKNLFWNTLAALLVVSFARENEDSVGTVIGIDLGTTYSW